MKRAQKKIRAADDFRTKIAEKLASVPKTEDNFWEVRLLLRSRSLFFCLNNIAVSIVSEVRGGGILGSASLDEIAAERMRSGCRSGRMNVEFHGMVQRLWNGPEELFGSEKLSSQVLMLGIRRRPLQVYMKYRLS